MAEKVDCPKCGAPSPAEGHKTIPHLATVRCAKCGEVNVAVKVKAESEPESEPESESEKGKATKKRAKGD